MNLRHLRSFVQVAELGSVTRAASSLFTVQSAISRQIKALEEELDTKLFVRHGRGLKLTEPGTILLTRATHILDEIETAKSEIVSSNKIVRGQVTIGMPPTVASVLAGSLAERLANEHPGIKLRFVDALSGTLLEWLQKREIDFAVLYDQKEQLNLRIFPLLLESLYLVMHPSNKLSTRKSITFRQLSQEKLVLPSSRHSLRKLIERVAGDKKVELKVSIDADGLVILKELVRRGVGSTILPLPSIHQEVSDGAICAKPISSPPITRKLVLALPTDRPSTNACLKASEILRLQVTKMVEAGLWTGKLLMPRETQSSTRNCVSY